MSRLSLGRNKERRIRVKVKFQLRLLIVIRKKVASLEPPPSDVHLRAYWSELDLMTNHRDSGKTGREPRRVGVLTECSTVPKVASIRKEERGDIEWATNRIFHRPAFPTIFWTVLFGYFIRISNSVCTEVISSFPLHIGFSSSGFFYWSEIHNHWPSLLNKEALTASHPHPSITNRWQSLQILLSISIRPSPPLPQSRSRCLCPTSES